MRIILSSSEKSGLICRCDRRCSRRLRIRLALARSGIEICAFRNREGERGDDEEEKLCTGGTGMVKSQRTWIPSKAEQVSASNTIDRRPNRFDTHSNRLTVRELHKIPRDWSLGIASFSFRRRPSSFPASRNFRVRSEQPLHRRWSLARWQEKRRAGRATPARIYGDRYFVLPARNRRACTVHVHRTKRRRSRTAGHCSFSRYLFSYDILVLYIRSALTILRRQYRIRDRVLFL